MKYLRVILIVLLLGCCTLWVASYWKITWVSSDGLLRLLIWNGHYGVERFESWPSDWYPWITGLTIGSYPSQPTFFWPVVWGYNDPELGEWWLLGNFWLPTLLLALPLAISASPWARRRRRAKQGLCIRCGYDLSGTDHEACPECGKQ